LVPGAKERRLPVINSRAYMFKRLLIDSVFAPWALSLLMVTSAFEFMKPSGLPALARRRLVGAGLAQLLQILFHGIDFPLNSANRAGPAR
jgi:hypothetical protein